MSGYTRLLILLALLAKCACNQIAAAAKVGQEKERSGGGGGGGG